MGLPFITSLERSSATDHWQITERKPVFGATVPNLRSRDHQQVTEKVKASPLVNVGSVISLLFQFLGCDRE